MFSGQVLNCKGMNHSVRMRVDDMQKLISGAANQLRNLQQAPALSSPHLSPSRCAPSPTEAERWRCC